MSHQGAYPQSWTKYLRQTQTEIVHCRKSSISIFFKEFFASIDKIFVLGGRLSTSL